MASEVLLETDARNFDPSNTLALLKMPPPFEYTNTTYGSATQALVEFDRSLDAYMQRPDVIALGDMRRTLYDAIASWFDMAYEDYTENNRARNSAYRLTQEYPGLTIRATITMS